MNDKNALNHRESVESSLHAAPKDSPVGSRLTRREAIAMAVASAASMRSAAAAESAAFSFRWLLSTAMYGQLDLFDLLPEATTLDMAALDLWPRVHGAQREAIDEHGLEVVRAHVEDAGCRVECLTRYDLGAAGLADEIAIAAATGAGTIVSGPKGSRTPPREALAKEVAAFVESMAPMHERAAEAGVTIAIENHRRNLFESADSLRYLAEEVDRRGWSSLKVALAPAHLPQQPAAVAQLVRDLGSTLHVFYAWERGNEFLRKKPTGRETEQLPGVGTFDFAPVVAALAAIDFAGWTSIFMHPVPRGIPAAGTVAATTTAIAAARDHLETLRPGAPDA